jgi:hypothetical protein
MFIATRRLKNSRYADHPFVIHNGLERPTLLRSGGFAPLPAGPDQGRRHAPVAYVVLALGALPMAAGIAWSTVGLIAEIVFARSDVTVRAHPAAADCPATEQVQQALDRQLGSNREGLRGWTVRYQPAARRPAPSRPELAVEVLDQNGALRTERHLVTGPADCAATADIVAAIVVRALRPLSWVSLPAQAPQPPQGELRMPPPPSKPGRWPDFTLGVGPAFVTGMAAAPNIAIELGVRGLGPLSVRAGVLILPLHAEESVGRAGTAELRRTALHGAVTWPWQQGPLLLELGPVVSFAVDRAETRGISGPDRGKRTVLSSGVLIGAGLGLGSRWRVGLWATALATVAASDFSVAVGSSDTVVLRQPALQGIAGLRLEWTPFP